MRYFRNLLILILCLSFISSANSRNDEQYYYKLGKKYMITKDYETAAKHFYKCMAVAEKNKSENPNYYYYPLLLYYYGAGKLKQVKKAAELITGLIPESPNTPATSGTAKEKYFNEFFDAYGIEIDRSDYIFLRHFVHFQSNEMEPVETFDRMEYAVRYHGERSLVPLEATFDLMREVYMKAYEKDDNPEESAAPFIIRLCQLFAKAAKEGSAQAAKLVDGNCE